MAFRGVAKVQRLASWRSTASAGEVHFVTSVFGALSAAPIYDNLAFQDARMNTLFRMAVPLALMALTAAAQNANEVKDRGATPLNAGPAPAVTLYGTLVDAGCRNRTALNLKQTPETFAAAAPAQTAAEAQSGSQMRTGQGYQNPSAPSQQPNNPVTVNGITVDAKTLATERYEILEHQVPDLRSRQLDPTCAITGATHSFALVLTENGRMLNLDDGGNTFANEAVQGSPDGRTMMSGKGGGFKPAAVVKGNIHADKVVVQTLKLTK
jgi:hypothetical protein